MSEPQTQYAYFQGRIVPISEATVPITTQSLHYGTGVFGGMRAYWNAEHEEAYIFRPYEHFERLLQSAALLRMKLDYTPASLLDILTALIQKEGFRTNCYIRPLAYIAEQTLAVRLHDLQPDLAGSGLGELDLLDGEDLCRVTELVLHECAHDSPLYGCRVRRSSRITRDERTRSTTSAGSRFSPAVSRSAGR